MAKLAKIKTQETDSSVGGFINTIEDEQKRKDSFTIVKLMEKATKEKAKMWGTAIIGFGNRRYKSPATGREVDWFIMGLSPRKANISIYSVMNAPGNDKLMAKLGKHKTGKGCLYINKLDDVDMKVLEQMINTAAKAKQ